MGLTPYSWVKERARVPLLIILITATIALSLVLSSIGQSLKNQTAPQGIISFELAGSGSRAEQIVSSWPEAARRDAFLSIGVDYLFLCVYPLAISLACIVASASLTRYRLLTKAGATLGWLVLGAGVLDAVENFAMIRMLKSTGGDAWPMVAKWCAIPKFSLVALGVFYLLLALLLLASRRFLRKPESKAA